MAVNENTIVQIEVALPGYPPVNGVIEVAKGDRIKIEAVQIEAHNLINDLFEDTRSRKASQQ